MKDLYTFDHTPELAMETYQRVREVYSEFFNRFKIPYLVAEASSGNMGGKVSHEYHFPSEAGEDHVVSCNNCSYVANAEVAECGSRASEISDSRAALTEPGRSLSGDHLKSHQRSEISSPIPAHPAIWSGIANSGLTLVNVFYLPNPARLGKSFGAHREINVHAVKSLIPSLDASLEDPVGYWKTKFRTPAANKDPGEASSDILNIYDFRCLAGSAQRSSTETNGSSFQTKVPKCLLDQVPTTHIHVHPTTGKPLDVLGIEDGDPCPRCSDGRLGVQKAVELGHTFFLGTRYSMPLHAFVDSFAGAKYTQEFTMPDSGSKLATESSTPPPQKELANSLVPLQMGCHGIGVSRMIGVVADLLADEKGLNWPRAIAPFEVVIVATEENEKDATSVYDELSKINPSQPLSVMGGDKGELDVVLDDRQKPFIPKLKDADLVGFPVIVILGRAWTSEGKCEVQCRRLKVHEAEVSLHELRAFVLSLLRQL